MKLINTRNLHLKVILMFVDFTTNILLQTPELNFIGRKFVTKIYFNSLKLK